MAPLYHKKSSVGAGYLIFLIISGLGFWKKIRKKKNPEESKNIMWLHLVLGFSKNGQFSQNSSQRMGSCIKGYI